MGCFQPFSFHILRYEYTRNCPREEVFCTSNFYFDICTSKFYSVVDITFANETFYFTPMSWGRTYKVRAFYQFSIVSGVKQGKYVESAPFTPSTDNPALSFTAQPTVGELDVENLKYPVTWTTGFKPVRLDIVLASSTSIDDYEWNLNDSLLLKDVTFYFTPMSWGRTYKLRAFYQFNIVSGVKQGKYVESPPFSLMINTVSFDAGGGSGVMGSIDLVGNAPYTLPECAFTWENHVFNKWQIGTEYYQPGDTVTFTENTTVRAIWKKYCTVTFNANGGTGSMASLTVLEGTVITLPENSFTRDDYNFSCWVLSSYVGSRFQPGRNVAVISDTTVTAVWVQKIWCTLTFDMQGYGTQVAPITVEKGTVATEPTKPTSNLKFAGWEINTGTSMEVWERFDFSQPVMQSTTLRAHWVSAATREARLSYLKEGGTVTLSAEGMDGLMIPVGERVHINITANPHWSVGTIRVGTLQLNTGVRVFDMPNQEIVTVSVTFVRDHDHTAQTLQVYQPYLAPTCEQEGHGLCYYCPTCAHYYNGRFTWLKDEAAVEALAIPALGHEYGAPTYEWAADYISVTATRVCTRDISHVETETVTTTAAVTLEPGPFTWGAHTYTAVFENPAFTEQTFTLDDIEPLGIPINEHIFPDSLFRSIVTGKDTDNNGYLSLAEREAVLQLNGANKKIVTYEGIQYFPNLTELAGQNNTALEELDVRMNPHLQKLTLNNSVKLTGLDLRQNLEMTYIQATNCGFADVYVANCPNLTYLNIAGCPVTHLDLSGNPLLKTLCAQNSSIKELDIGSNPHLLEACNGTHTMTTQYERYVSGSYVLQAGLNTVIRNGDELLINGAPFPDTAFRAYVSETFDTNNSGWLSDEEIAAITDISMDGFDSLENVTGIEYFTELDRLELTNNSSLSGVDLLHNTKLTYVDLEYNALTSLRLDGLASLQALYISGNSLETLDISGVPHLIAAWLGTKDSSHAEYDRYTADGYVLSVDKGLSIITGIPAPAFTLPAALTAIEADAFQGIAATAVRIPASVTTIEGDPFSGSQVQFIYGTPGTAAETFANANGYTFVSVGE